MIETVYTQSAPAAIGPYSQAVKFGNILFTSGQIPVDPATGAVVEGDIKAQTAQVMKNLTALLAASGTSPEKALKTTCFLAIWQISQRSTRFTPRPSPVSPPAPAWR